MEILYPLCNKPPYEQISSSWHLRCRHVVFASPAPAVLQGCEVRDAVELLSGEKVDALVVLDGSVPCGLVIDYEERVRTEESAGSIPVVLGWGGSVRAEPFLSRPAEGADAEVYPDKVKDAKHHRCALSLHPRQAARAILIGDDEGPPLEVYTLSFHGRAHMLEYRGRAFSS